MTEHTNTWLEIDSCHSLFLREATEPSENGLRLIVEEAIVLPEQVSVRIGGTDIAGAHPVKSTESSRTFEIVWGSYVAYSLINESFASNDGSEEFSGRLLRTYTKSHFLEYVSRATIACNEYPGPVQHTEVICECHVIGVVSLELPRVQQIQFPARLQPRPSGASTK